MIHFTLLPRKTESLLDKNKLKNIDVQIQPKLLYCSRANSSFFLRNFSSNPATTDLLTSSSARSRNSAVSQTAISASRRARSEVRLGRAAAGGGGRVLPSREGDGRTKGDTYRLPEASRRSGGGGINDADDARATGGATAG